MTKEIKWNFEVGQHIKDEKRDLILTKKEIRDRKLIDKKCKSGFSINHQKFYGYTCNICKWDDGWIEESNLQKGQGCSCCAGKTVVKGINDIATVRPDLLDYFVNIENAYTHTVSANKEDIFKCPTCKKRKKMKYATLSSQGLSCNRCSDGLSYPEKLLCSILDELEIDYIFQLTSTTFDWIGNYRYDFYLINYNCIIEAHGGQHYEQANFTNRTLEEEQENDRLKQELAYKNGFNENNYIVIDCRKSYLEWIKSSILNSELTEYLDFTNLDWDKLDQVSNYSLIKEVCDFYNSIPHGYGYTGKICERFKISDTTRRKYLHLGHLYGWCSYITDSDDVVDHGTYKMIKTNKAVNVYKDNKYLSTYKSATYLCEKSLEDFGVQFNITKVSAVCHGTRKHHHGYTFEYVNEKCNGGKYRN